MPHRARDPIVAASHIVTAVQTIVSRVVDPLDNAVVSITAIHGGEAFNVIPDRVEMKGTIRTFSEAVSKSIEAELARICERTAEAFGTNARLHRPPKLPYPATVNHPAETELALGAMRAVAGPDRVRDDMRPVMGSEDFAFVLRKVPGAYIFIGNGDTAGLHNPKYDFNDEAIPYGVAYWTELARRVAAGLNGQSIAISRASARRPWIAVGQRSSIMFTNVGPASARTSAKTAAATPRRAPGRKRTWDRRQNAGRRSTTTRRSDIRAVSAGTRFQNIVTKPLSPPVTVSAI